MAATPTNKDDPVRLPTWAEMDDSAGRALLEGLRELREKKKPNVLVGPVNIEGLVARLIKEPNGSGRMELWREGAGWISAAGSITLDQFMPGACRPASVRDAARIGMPTSELIAELDRRRPRLVIDHTTIAPRQA